MEYIVRDGVRKRPLEGVKLAESSSRLPNKDRWVEFTLYKTTTGVYVLSRVGRSLTYHGKDCYTVARNKLSPVDGLELSGDYVPCPKCRPDRGDIDGVFPETPRYAAWSCQDPVGVISLLMKEDENGTEYLTNVARRLLMDASEADSKIKYYFENDRIE
jgi:hypothetical protein